MDHHTIATKARRLLAFACDLGWAAVASRVLPLATAKCSCANEMVAAIHASTSSQPGGLSLLHRAVRSGNLALIQGMLHWGKVHSYQWRADRRGPFGITPLHLAALSEEPRVMLSLLDHCPQGAFTQLVADDGSTPFHLAFQMGHFPLDQLLQMLSNSGMPLAIKPKQEQPTHGRRGHHHQQQASSEMDPCEHCHSTLPPLLLSIMASCADCGSRVPCMDNAGHASGHESSCCAVCVKTEPCCADEGHSHAHHHKLADLSPPLWDANNMAAGDVCDPCAHQHGNVYSITALCQSCHGNRTLEVA